MIKEENMEQGLVEMNRTALTWNEIADPSGAILSGRDDFEYLLVIHPDMEVYSKVIGEKQRFYEQYNAKTGSRAKPHITVASFVAKESMEETLIRWIQRVCSRQKSFTVTLNNYSGIPPHTVYLRVQDHLPFSLLVQNLAVINEYIQSNGCPPVKWANRPHLSISGRLPEEVYEQAMREYAQRIFCETFTAGELVLLRRSHVADSCKIINIFGLLPE